MTRGLPRPGCLLSPSPARALHQGTSPVHDPPTQGNPQASDGSLSHLRVLGTGLCGRRLLPDAQAPCAPLLYSIIDPHAHTSFLFRSYVIDWKAEVPGGDISQSAPAALTTVRGTEGRETFVSHGSGGWESKIEAPAGGADGERALPGSQTATAHRTPTWRKGRGRAPGSPSQRHGSCSGGLSFVA